MDKSRASQRTGKKYTVKTINKSGSISSSSLYDNSKNTEQQKKINVRSDRPSLSSMSRPVTSVLTVSSEKQRIHYKDKEKKESETFIKEK